MKKIVIANHDHSLIFSYRSGSTAFFSRKIDIYDMEIFDTKEEAELELDVMKEKVSWFSDDQFAEINKEPLKIWWLELEEIWKEA